MPHIHEMIPRALRASEHAGAAPDRDLLKAALFTAREAALGFAMGATGGFILGTLLAHSRMLQRGFLPYVIASRPCRFSDCADGRDLARVGARDAWISVSVIAAYLTFFPVVIATLRGLHTADHRAVEADALLRRKPVTVLWKLRFPAALPYLFTALRVSATASIVGAIIGEQPSSIAGGLAERSSTSRSTTTSSRRTLWATNIQSPHSSASRSS